MLTLLDMLRARRVEWDVLLLQEISRADVEFEQATWDAVVGKHIIYVNPHKPWDVAIVVHEDLILETTRVDHTLWSTSLAFVNGGGSTSAAAALTCPRRGITRPPSMPKLAARWPPLSRAWAARLVCWAVTPMWK